MSDLNGPRRGFAHRIALARQRVADGARGPGPRRFWVEVLNFPRSVLPARPARDKVSALRAQPVMLLPGFAANPARMRRLGRALSSAGHRVEHWGLGVNLGPSEENLRFLLDRVDELAKRHGRPIVLVGWSLGGLFAREIARRHPHSVSKVITMGTPFSGDRRANNVWRAYQFVAGHPVDELPVDCDFATKPAVTTIALWSARDGAIHPRAARGQPHERDRAVAMRCTHMGFTSDPAVFAEVLRQLDADD